jgi:large subunit ribosomal protein L28
MTHKCSITGRKAMGGNNVSHAKNRTKRKFQVNLQNKKYWSDALGKFVQLKNISTKAMRTIDKHGGIDEMLKLSKDKEEK